MGETRRKFDQDFREGAVRLVRKTGKPVAQVAQDLGVNEAPWGTESERGEALLVLCLALPFRAKSPTPSAGAA
jgi:hypothetical protein